MNKILLKNEIDMLATLIINYSISFLLVGKSSKEDVISSYNVIEEYIEENIVDDSLKDRFNRIKILMNILNIKLVEIDSYKYKVLETNIKDKEAIKLLRDSLLIFD